MYTSILIHVKCLKLFVYVTLWKVFMECLTSHYYDAACFHDR